MNAELNQIKKGERYKIELLCILNKDNEIFVFETPTGDHIPIRKSDIESISPAEKPKYDPCRLFKKGDKVKRRTVDGRTNQELTECIELTVIYSKDKYGNVRVQLPSGISIVTKSVFLELVTPVEELEPYTLEEETTYIDDEECGICENKLKP